MDGFLRAGALVMVAAVLGLMLRKENPSGAVVLSLGACCLVLVAAAEFLGPVMELLQRLRELTGVGGQMLSVLLKAAGIGLVAELAALICSDAGEGALGKAIGFLASAATLWVSLPLMEELLALLQGILEGL